MEAAPRKHCPFWVKEVKEFWLEPNPELSAETICKMVVEAKPHMILTDVKLPRVASKVASRLEGTDILVTSDFDHALSAKKNETPVALEVTISDQKDLESISRALELRPDYLLINCPNWKIIPLENLIAETKGRSKLLARTTSFDESKAALATLELGADGIALTFHDMNEILKTRDLILGESENISLSTAQVTVFRPIRTGALVCVEASIGNRKITTIVQNAETVRLVTKDGSKPLSEIKPGDEVLVRSEEGGRHFGTKVADEMVIER